MAERPKEPQSYGSERDWLTGDTDQQINRLTGHPNSQHADFYQPRRESEENAPDQGGYPSSDQIAESRQATGRSTGEETTPVQKVTDRPGGSKTGSYFKKRDYE